ncbi:MAG: glycosyltransferase family 4 protein, partial [Polyangiales bacterium]
LDLPQAEVIPNPAPMVEVEQRWKLAECDPDLVLFVGRFDRHKGGDLVIDAFSRVASRRPGLKLVFIGPDRGLDGGVGGTLGLNEYVLDRVPDLSVRARIQHLGQLPPEEIKEWRKKARVTIVASRFEVFGMVVVEALAFGCPLIAANAGGIPEIVAHEENGLLFEKGDAADLAHWLQTMLDHPELSAELGSRGVLEMERRFSPDVIARRTRDYYERVIAD